MRQNKRFYILLCNVIISSLQRSHSHDQPSRVRPVNAETFHQDGVDFYLCARVRGLLIWRQSTGKYSRNASLINSRDLDFKLPVKILWLSIT